MPIPSQPRFLPDLLELMEHSALTSKGDWKKVRDFVDVRLARSSRKIDRR